MTQKPEEPEKKRLMVLVAVGRRCERRKLLRSMRREIDFDVATRDESTAQYPRDEFRVIRLQLRYLKGSLL